MRNIVLYIAASLDGYIARDDHSLDWLPTPDAAQSLDYGYSDFYASIDTTIMGKRTYDIVRAHGVENPYPEKKNYVFTRSARHLSNDDIQYVSGDVIEFTQNLKAQQGSDIWLVGGGDLNTLFLNYNLIDRIILAVIPIVLGGGIPLFARGGRETLFKLSNAQHWTETGVVQMTYEKM
jgi:dihydrofolate reductase